MYHGWHGHHGHGNYYRVSNGIVSPVGKGLQGDSLTVIIEDNTVHIWSVNPDGTQNVELGSFTIPHDGQDGAQGDKGDKGDSAYVLRIDDPFGFDGATMTFGLPVVPDNLITVFEVCGLTLVEGRDYYLDTSTNEITFTTPWVLDTPSSIFYYSPENAYADVDNRLTHLEGKLTTD